MLSSQVLWDANPEIADREYAARRLVPLCCDVDPLVACSVGKGVIAHLPDGHRERVSAAAQPACELRSEKVGHRIVEPVGIGAAVQTCQRNQNVRMGRGRDLPHVEGAAFRQVITDPHARKVVPYVKAPRRLHVDLVSACRMPIQERSKAHEEQRIHEAQVREIELKRMRIRSVSPPMR
jgi:hypothetical protein